MKTLRGIITWVCIQFLIFHGLFAQEPLKTTARGQFNAWSVVNYEHNLKIQPGARFIPELTLEKPFEQLQMDAEVSFNTTGHLNYDDWKYTGSYESFKPYRLWTRISSNRYEVRAGLQKINFGSATLLRPLMWFDRIDPRDPLQITDGVYGILGRYYFLNNANIWLWSLYGNDQTKGWEIMPSAKNTPEWGGRFQFPVPKGETALSFHSRTADLNSLYPDSLLNNKTHFIQNKYGLDGKWDVGVGLWFEYVLTENRLDSRPRPFHYQHALNLGLDYTFNLGNGLHIASEFFYLNLTDRFFKPGTQAEISALSIDYPLGLMDRISGMIYYSWKDKHWYRFISLKRTYDYWSFFLMGFWNPTRFALYNINEEQNLFAGKGLQIMAVYNF